MNNKKNLTIKEVFNLAVQNHQNNNLKDAQNYYQKVLEIDPNYVNAHNNLGAIFNDLREHQKAKDCYKKAIEIDPNYVNAHFNLGRIYIDLDEHQKAKECYQKAIELNPNHINAHFNLGAIFKVLGEHQKAKSSYEKAIELNPNFVDAHNNLGNIFKELGDIQKAKSCYEKAITIDSNNLHSINFLVEILGMHNFDYRSETDKNKFKELILLLFRKDNINHSNISIYVKLLLLTDSVQNQFLKDVNSEMLLNNKVLRNLIKEELFHLMLQKVIVPDKFLEKLLTQLRCEILFTLDGANKDILKEHFNFIISLAEQCWLNEYIYNDSEKEISLIIKLIDKIENNNSINEMEIAILGCFIPLNKSKIIIKKLFNYNSTNILFNDLINVQIKEPLKEKELARSIKSLDVIEDIVSKKVQEQYEEHPYPRWRYTNKCFPQKFFVSLNSEIKPNNIIHNKKFNNPNVLIAGCGTGSHSISAIRYKNANILAVDLSKSSLGYAKRKTDELGLKNIEYIHADILQLNKLNTKFDIIESGGVLHHMKDPIRGLKVLVDILEPHGFLKLGLYSETARRHVVEARKFIKKKNYKNTSKDIKICRQDIINKKANPLMQKLFISTDFYSTSNVRDLLFHVQEYRFTIPKISKILKDLNLEFLGFFFIDPLVKKEFSKSFPNDKNNTSLDNWHQFELNNPNIFKGMYQFWVRKSYDIFT